MSTLAATTSEAGWDVASSRHDLSSTHSPDAPETEGYSDQEGAFGFVHSLETGSTVDGPGVRATLFVSGCFLRCQYCHNPDTWHLKRGTRVSIETALARLAGLEPAGQIPDLQKIPRGSLGPSLHTVSSSMHTVLSLSFFITHNMRTQLSAGRLNGTIPILYVFLARSGKTVKEVSLVNLDADGNERAEEAGSRDDHSESHQHVQQRVDLLAAGRGSERRGNDRSGGAEVSAER